MADLPDSVDIVCTDRGRHSAEVIYSRHVDVALGTTRAAVKNGSEDLELFARRLDSTELRCPVCDRTERIRDTDLNALVVALTAKANELRDDPAARRVVLQPELAGIRYTLRAIR